MDHRHRMVLACGAIAGIFLVVQLGALAFVDPAEQQGLQEVEGGGSATLSLAFVGAMLVMTAFMLAAIRYGGASLLRVFIILASVYISFFALEVFAAATLGGETATPVAVAAALALGAALYLYPEWYVIDGAGVVMGIGAAGLFGVNFGVLPAIVLLVVLAVYDAISVYGTEHMLTLASGVMEMRVPVVLVVPLTLSYSFLDTEGPDSLPDGETGEGDVPGDETAEGKRDDAADAEGEGDPPALTASELSELGPEGVAALDEERLAGLDPDVLDEVEEPVRESVREAMPDRDALYIGLGDVVMPTVLVASAAFFVDTGPTVEAFGVSAALPAVTAMAGTLLGLTALLWLVARGRAHAGLPLLNGGSVGGYLLGALASGMSLVEALGLSGTL